MFFAAVKRIHKWEVWHERWWHIIKHYYPANMFIRGYQIWHLLQRKAAGTFKDNENWRGREKLAGQMITSKNAYVSWKAMVEEQYPKGCHEPGFRLKKIADRCSR